MSSERRIEGDTRPATRADLLSRQRSAMAGLADRRWSPRRLVPPTVASVVLLVTGLVWDGDGGPGAVRIVVFCVVLVAWGAVMWRHARVSRRLERERREWSAIDRTADARALRPGDLDPLTATIWDARDRTDLEEVARNIGLERLGVIYGWRPSLSLFVGLAAAILTSILVADTLLETFGDAGAPGRLMGVVASTAVALTGVALTWTSGREYWRRQLAWNQAALERQVYLLRRHALGGPETTPDPRLPRWARPLAATVVAGIVVAVSFRAAVASPAVLGVAGGLLLVVVLAVAVAVARAQRLHVVPMRAGDDDVLSSGRRFVRVEVTEDAVEIRDLAGTATSVSIGLHSIREVGAIAPVYPWVPGPAVIVADDEPVVLAGRGADGVRSRIATRLEHRAG